MSLIPLILVSLVFYYLMAYKNPFIITMMVILSTVFLGISLMSMNMSWFFYSIIVMFLGGMMVVFVYASSLSTLFKIESSLGINWLSVMLGPFIISILVKSMCFYSNKTPLMLYSSNNEFMLIYLVIFLLSVLLLVVKLSTSETGPLKL